LNQPTDKTKFLLTLATTASVLVALSLTAIKGVAWYQTGSIAMLGSLLDSILDTAASILNLLFVRHALQPADGRHRFGHGKAEPLGGIFQAMIIGASALFLSVESARRLMEPVMPTNTDLGITIMLISSAVVALLVILQRYVVKQTESLVVEADALHGFGDIVINLGVIFALVVSTQFNAPYIDPVVGFALAGILLRGAWHIGQRAMQQLMDEEFSDEEREKIRTIIQQHPHANDIHDLRTRRAGLSSFIQLHLELDGDMKLEQAHIIADEVEALILEEFPNAEVLIHQDPHGKERVTSFMRS
jgi:ferrous-iron efflux pump FieF